MLPTLECLVVLRGQGGHQVLLVPVAVDSQLLLPGHARSVGQQVLLVPVAVVS